MNNRFAQVMVISGLPDTGIGTTTQPTTSGFRAHGCWPPRLVSCGLRAGGVGAARHSFFMRVTGDRQSGFTAGSIMDSVTLEWVLRADAGTMDTSSITEP